MAADRQRAAGKSGVSLPVVRIGQKVEYRPIVPQVELPDAFNLCDIGFDPLGASGPLTKPGLGPFEGSSRNIKDRDPLK